MVYVIKRLKNKEEFNASKIEVAIKKAFFSCNKEIDKNHFDKIMQRILSSIEILGQEEINIETIQDIIEETLMRFCYYDVAKSFILYREKHKNIRNNVERNLQFIDNFIKSDNTANATIDDNSNVSTHNIAVMNTEIHKEDNKETNIRIWYNKIKELYGKELAEQFIVDLNTICYAHDLSSQIGMPYCVAISLYPFLLNGIKDIGGLSAAPKNIDSFCGLFINLVFSIASQYKGAVATPGVLLCMDYFLRKEWGNDYYLKGDLIISSQYSNRRQTIKGQIHQYFQQIVYSLMQPSGSRGNQSVFWNLSIFDKPFFDTMYGDFYFPDGDRPNWESLKWLQKDFLHWFNQERLKCILTFPVVSLCLIYKDNKFIDEDLYEFACQEYSEGNSFFTYISDSADSLSSCCRLSSKISKPQFNFTNGQLSEMTGSKNVITLNLNRIVQDYFKTVDTNYFGASGILYKDITEEDMNGFKDYLIKILERVYKYKIAYKTMLYDMEDKGMYSSSNAGYIYMKKLYCTIGVIGYCEAAQFLGLNISNNKEYKEFLKIIFETIQEQNKLHSIHNKKRPFVFNLEAIPKLSGDVKSLLIDSKLL